VGLYKSTEEIDERIRGVAREYYESYDVTRLVCVCMCVRACVRVCIHVHAHSVGRIQSSVNDKKCVHTEPLCITAGFEV